MATAKKAAKKSAKKSTAKKATAKKAPAKKAAAKKSSAKKATAKKAPAKKATAKRSTAKKSAAGAGGDRAMLVSKSKIKETLKSHGKRTDSALIDALNDEIHTLLSRAAERAEGNKRGTVRPGDL